MSAPEAGPSRSPRPAVGQPEHDSSDEIEEVPLSSRKRAAAKAKRPVKSKTGTAVEGESQDLTTPAAQPAPRSRRIPRTTATSTRTTVRSTTAVGPTTKTKLKGKEKSADRDDTILVEESTDEDEPMFVGASIAKKLSSKYTFQPNSVSKSNSSLSSSSSSSIVITSVNSKQKPIVVEDEKPQPPPLPLLAPLEPAKPPPVPAWLGRTAVLLQIPYCVVCRVRWKKEKENGAARWVCPHLTSNTGRPLTEL